jgi:hypothetical protein
MEKQIDDFLLAGKSNIAAAVRAELPKDYPDPPALDTLRDHVQRARRKLKRKKRAK